MSAISDLYLLNDCAAMNEQQLRGLQSLIADEPPVTPLHRTREVRPVTVDELSALQASPVLRPWLDGKLRSYGGYWRSSLLAGRIPLSMPEYLGALRAEIIAIAGGK